MSDSHLLSASLFSELFQHNLASSDGRIIASEQQLRDFSTFLIQQSKDRVTRLYAKRKNLVKEAEDLLRQDGRTQEEEKRLQELVDELDLKFEEDGLLSLKEPAKPQQRQLGAKELEKSTFERRIEAELKSARILKRDLKKLGDWLEQISQVRSAKDPERGRTDSKEALRKYKERTINRMNDLEKARQKFISNQYKDYEEKLKSNLGRKLPQEKYLTRIGLKAKDVKDMDVTRDSKKTNAGVKNVSNKAKKSVKTVNREGEDQDYIDDETVVKDYDEDANVTTEADIGGDNAEDETNETVTSINENNAEDEGMATETETSVAIEAEKCVDDEVADGKNEDAASEKEASMDANIAEDGGVTVKSEADADDEINVTDNTVVKDTVMEAKDAVIEAADRVNEVSSKMQEIKELMVSSEDEILKDDASDAAESQINPGNLDNAAKTQIAAEMMKNKAKLRDAVTKATGAVIEATDEISKMFSRMHRVKTQMMELEEKLNEKSKEVGEEDSTSNTDHKNVATKFDNNEMINENTQKNTIRNLQKHNKYVEDSKEDEGDKEVDTGEKVEGNKEVEETDMKNSASYKGIKTKSDSEENKEVKQAAATSNADDKGAISEWKREVSQKNTVTSPEDLTKGYFKTSPSDEDVVTQVQVDAFREGNYADVDADDM